MACRLVSLDKCPEVLPTILVFCTIHAVNLCPRDTQSMEHRLQLGNGVFQSRNVTVKWNSVYLWRWKGARQQGLTEVPVEQKEGNCKNQFWLFCKYCLNPVVKTAEVRVTLRKQDEFMKKSIHIRKKNIRPWK